MDPMVNLKYIGAGLALIGTLGVGLGLGNLFAAWITAIARNPAASDQYRQVGFIGLALTEAIALFALVVAFMILFV